MRKTTLLLFACLATASAAFSQGVITNPRTVLGTVSGITRPIANATITVCAANAGGIPCSPALAGQTFKDAALTQPLSNPFTTDANGNYQFAIAPGNYTVTETAAGFSGYSYQISASCSPVGGCTFSGPVLLTAGGTLSGTFSGNPTFTGTETFANINGALNPLLFSGSDIGAQINAANAAFPGQPIVIPPSSTCYQFSTPIVINAGSVPTSVKGAGAGSTCLQYTASSGTAFSFSSALTNGIAGTISDFELMTTVAGSTATGLAVGTGNTCSNCKVQRMYIHGFQNDTTTATYQVEYAQDEISNCSTAAGSIGLQTTGAFADDTKILGGRIINCSTLLKIGNVFVVWVDGLLLQNAGSLWVDNTSSGILECNHCHWYNISTGPATNWFSSTGQMIISNSLFEDAKTTGTPTQFATQTGSFISFNNNNMVTNGESPSQFVTLSGTVVAEFGNNINESPASIPSLWNTAYVAGTVNAFGNSPNVNTIQNPLYFIEGTIPGSGTPNQDACAGDSSTHTVKCSYNNGTFFQLAQVIPATSAAFATATTAGTCVQNVTAVAGATTSMTVSVSPVSTPGVGAVWSAFVSSAGNVTINECAVATSAGGTIAFNIRVTP